MHDTYLPSEGPFPYDDHLADIRDDFSFRLRRNIQHMLSNASRLFGQRFNPAHFDIKRLAVDVTRLPAPFHGYRIVHISDIHYGQWVSAERMAGVADLINRQQPDLVAITGDFVSYSDRKIDEMAAGLKAIRAKDAVVAVLGNHDYWLNAAKVRSILRASRIRELRNEVQCVTRGDRNLYFAGVESVSIKKHQLGMVLHKLPSDGPAVLLAHEPHFADLSSKTARFSLQLSGHSHGGQCIIPKFGSPVIFSEWRKYFSGLYKVGGMVLYTNRGLGTNNFWFRLNCKPEITVIELLAGQCQLKA